nr:hypothetical protein [Methylomarinum sp. Ch1-1]MDP4523155.1 hypothetical protein [Methylomarinum sp. Ch1-1]
MDSEESKWLLIKQLGRSFAGVDDLAIHERILAAAFMAFIAGQKDKGQKLLDQASLSFVEPRSSDEALIIDDSGSKEMISKYIDNESVQYAIKNHSSYVKTWLMALLSAARKKVSWHAPNLFGSDQLIVNCGMH